MGTTGRKPNSIIVLSRSACHAAGASLVPYMCGGFQDLVYPESRKWTANTGLQPLVGRSKQVITSLSMGELLSHKSTPYFRHRLRTVVHIHSAHADKLSFWIGFSDSSWSMMIDSAFFESAHLLLPNSGRLATHVIIPHKLAP